MKIRIILILILSCLGFSVSLANAQSLIKNINMSSPEDARVSLTWITDKPSKSYVFFGPDKNNLNFYVGHLEYRQSHEATLSGLRRNQDYYYKIVVTDINGVSTESFVNYFNTNNMKSTKPPVISNFKRQQVIDTAAALSFSTNEETRVEIIYGIEEDNLNKSWRKRVYDYDHSIIINRLLPGEKYFFIITVWDRDDNSAIYQGSFNTDAYQHQEIKMTNLFPSDQSQSLNMPERAIISWKSNLLATSEIVYGTDPNRLRSRVRVSTDANFDHYINLDKLEPDTDYYYQIKMSSPLNNLRFESKIYSFKTTPLSQEYLSLDFQSGDMVEHRRSLYFIYEDMLVPIYNKAKDRFSLFERAIKSIKNEYLGIYHEAKAYFGVFHDGQVVKTDSSPSIYLIDGEYRRPLANWAVFQYLNYRPEDIVITNRNDLNSYKVGELVSHSQQITGDGLGAMFNNRLLKSESDATVYLIVNNQKLPFFSESVFKREGYDFSQVETVPKDKLNVFMTGQIII